MTARARGPILVAGLGVLLPAVVSWGYAVDDAWIVARYAERLLGGLGYTFNDGPATDGVTGPLGLVPALLGGLVGAPVEGAKVAGVVAAGLAAALATGFAARDGRAPGWAAALWLVACPLVGVWAAAGLETGLATLAFTALCLGAARASGALVGAATLALAWLRPECAPAALVALALLRGAPRREVALGWGLAVAGAASVVAFRLAMFGHPLPLSAAAKPADLVEGLGYVGRGALIVFGGLGLVAVARGAVDPARRRVAWILAAHGLAVALAGGDWMPGFRLLVPMVPAAAWLASGATRDGGRRAWAWIAASLVIPLLAGGLAILDAREAARARDTEGRALARLLAARAQRVALVDVGFLVYASGVEAVDLGGVTDPAIGRLPGGHADKRLDPGLLAARAPDAVVLHSTAPPRVDDEGRLRGLAGHPVERRVAETPWVRERMRVVEVVRYAPAYWYVVLAPADSPAPPRASPAPPEGGTLIR